MKKGRTLLQCLATLLLCAATGAAQEQTTAKEYVFTTRPFGMKLSIKEVGPYMQAADLQIICLLKHKPEGDVYQGAAKETDSGLGGILSTLRNRGKFIGELGETFLFTPIKGSIPAIRFMIIGLGDEKELSLDSLRVVGRIAAREAVRLHAEKVAWAPVIRDEGNTRIEVGAGDCVFVEQMLHAYDTEIRLQVEGLSPEFRLKEFVIEAGPAFFDSVVKEVGEGIEKTVAELGRQDPGTYRK